MQRAELQPLFDDIGDSMAVGPAHYEYARVPDDGSGWQRGGDDDASVWLAHDVFNGKPVVVKAARTGTHGAKRIQNEIDTYTRVLRGDAAKATLSTVMWSGQCSTVTCPPMATHTVIVMACEGPDLNRLLELHGHFSLRTVVSIGVQVLHSLEALHKVGFVHGGIKPHNVVAGGPQHPDKVILIDFDSGREYSLSRATAPYASSARLCDHRFRFGYAEDVIALSYMLLRFLRGRRCMPWDVMCNSKTSRRLWQRTVARLRDDTPVAWQCGRLPKAFQDYMELAEHSRSGMAYRYGGDMESTVNIEYAGMRNALIACLRRDTDMNLDDDAACRSSREHPVDFSHTVENGNGCGDKISDNEDMAAVAVTSSTAALDTDSEVAGGTESTAEAMATPLGGVEAWASLLACFHASEAFNTKLRNGDMASAGDMTAKGAATASDVFGPVDRGAAVSSAGKASDLSGVWPRPPLDWTTEQPSTGTCTEISATTNIAGWEYWMAKPPTECVRENYDEHGRKLVRD